MKDWSGQKFGKLTAIAFHERRSSHSYWNFRCDCGEIVSRVPINVKKQVNSGCPKCRQGSGSHAFRGAGDISQEILCTHKHSAIARGLEFDITVEYVWELFQKQGGKCRFTGWPLYFNKTSREMTNRTASLDRIDSSKGYVRGNVQWVHRDVNKLKKNMNDELFIMLCESIANKASAELYED